MISNTLVHAHTSEARLTESKGGTTVGTGPNIPEPRGRDTTGAEVKGCAFPGFCWAHAILSSFLCFSTIVPFADTLPFNPFPHRCASLSTRSRTAADYILFLLISIGSCMCVHLYVRRGFFFSSVHDFKYILYVCTILPPPHPFLLILFI